MLEELEALFEEAKRAIAAAEDLAGLEAVRVRFLGRKGELTGILRRVSQLPPEERPMVGRRANAVKEELERLLAQREEELKAQALAERLKAEAVDVTLPGRAVPLGHYHPLTLVLEEIERIFLGLGFSVVEGPEVELDWYNFEALNIPKDHPARDMQDTFFITDEVLLRTHTSPVQVRVLEKLAPHLPVKVIAPGKVYRRDDDATHSPMFHQVEGLAVDRNIRFSDLKGVLLAFAREMFGPNTRLRFRPSYFPFTEPSAEVDISCVICGGKGCRVCKDTGWLEILGAGMVHPHVLSVSGYDPAECRGFAFGLGIERIAMLKYGINDLRLFFTNDWRFLSQF
ncbi:phenylalanyl-tRNA synthetase, alpha subunit [Ammonifex degensii KC4]|uniref:Phenylalanine--tRNA ligase alpha subunit n=1 Tax=Ammonifex degensii (strain DSM 10501 / KC4) TaxID=429009 RepID=C9RBR1_AMMDK|nr:phenylalanine--tRNA ligase subunit alpha [Ammonifex degensii]ACX51688.1 phenylalanyl-tRNA synthetase, alpha subunit [Ammonifex degensii KC4]